MGGTYREGSVKILDVFVSNSWTLEKGIDLQSFVR